MDDLLSLACSLLGVREADVLSHWITDGYFHLNIDKGLAGHRHYRLPLSSLEPKPITDEPEPDIDIHS